MIYNRQKRVLARLYDARAYVSTGGNCEQTKRRSRRVLRLLTGVIQELYRG
jgi:hypothetical protein